MRHLHQEYVAAHDRRAYLKRGLSRCKNLTEVSSLQHHPREQLHRRGPGRAGRLRNLHLQVQVIMQLSPLMARPQMEGAMMCLLWLAACGLLWSASTR